MVSSVRFVTNYVYVVIRLQMAESVNSRLGTTLLCYYGETNDIFPLVVWFSLARLVQPQLYDIVTIWLLFELSITIAYI